MTHLCVGIDVAAHTITVATWTAGRGTLIGTFPNTPDGFLAMHAALPAADSISLALEPTGGYEIAVAHFAIQRGWLVFLPNPKRVRDFARSRGRRAKTDGQDALLLACFAAEGDAQPWHPLPEEVAHLESLQRRKDDLEKLLRQERNRQLALHRPGQHRAVAGSVERVIAVLEEELKAVERELAQHVRAHVHLKQAVKLLRTVPGVGAKTAVPLLLVLWRWNVLTEGKGSTKGLTAYVGLDPQPYESGTSVSKRPMISRMGDRSVRRQLFMAVLGGVRHANVLRDFYQRLVGRGKRKKVALVAAERKLLIWAWKVFQTQSAFDGEKTRAHVAPS